MQLPAPTSSYSKRVQYGRYVARRLRRAQKLELSTAAEASTAAVKQSGRAWEDASEPLEDALADRDFADDFLDTTAKKLRLALASRDLKATKQPPYTDIFPDGIDYYTTAPLSEEVKRYQELATRLEAHVPKHDSARTEFLPKLAQGIADFQAAEQEVNKARNQLALAGSALDATEAAWARQMEKVYAALVDSFGKSEAETFFPKTRNVATKTREKTTPES